MASGPENGSAEMGFVIVAVFVVALVLVLSGRLGPARKSRLNQRPPDDPHGDGDS